MGPRLRMPPTSLQAKYIKGRVGVKQLLPTHKPTQKVPITDHAVVQDVNKTGIKTRLSGRTIIKPDRFSPEMTRKIKVAKQKETVSNTEGVYITLWIVY